MNITLVSEYRCFEGKQQRYKHHSEVLNCEMFFSIFLPPQLDKQKNTTTAPCIYWLSGLSCTDENFVQKAGAQKTAAELGLILVSADTSPRGDKVPDDENQSYDFGLGAGFYVDALQSPWSDHYQMYSYISKELPRLIEQHFPVNPDQKSIAGHSMGGHGALTIGLKNPENYRSTSAFAPICSPINSPWGQKALTNYLSDDPEVWRAYDATELIKQAQHRLPILIDQGDNDDFLDQQLKPELLLAAAKAANYDVEYRLREGYDHSYFYIASFIEAHLRFHYKHLLD